MTKLTTEERIKSCQIRLLQENPFWAYLTLYLKFQKVPPEQTKVKWKDGGFGMGVDINGNVFYSEDFVNELDSETLLGTITHELSHLVFATILRQGSRDKEMFNVASDLAINSLLIRDEFKLPKGVLIPNNNDEFDTGFGVIKDVSKLTAEEIYDLLPKIKIKVGYYTATDGKGKEKEIGKVLDVHIEGKGADGKELTEEEKREIGKEWQNRVLEAYISAKQKGDVPEGIERFVGKLFESKINWKTILQRYIINSIPYSFTYARPNKRSISIGEYMPSTLKEKVSIGICVDVSGSVGDDELGEFLSEIVGIARAFQDTLEMTIYFHETEINEKDVYVIANGNIEKIMDMKIHGGGGTSHIQPFKFIQENLRGSRAVIFLTDGFSDLDGINFDNYSFDKLFVISKGGDDSQLKGKNCGVIHLKGEE